MSVRARSNVKVLGRGTRPMLFAHGFGCDQNMWRFVTPAFEADYKVVLFDHVGFGASDAGAYRRAKYESLDGYASDVLEICSELELRDVVFVGHSVSAMIGAVAAIREPSRFASLIMIGPSPRYIDDRDAGYVGGFSRQDIDGLLDSLDANYLGWSRAIAPTIMGNPERPELATELANAFCRADPEIAKHFARVTFLSDNRDDLPKVPVPSLVIQCVSDVIAPPSVGEYVQRNLPRAELCVLDATGHCPNLSAPDEVVAAMKRFLASRPDAPIDAAS